MALCRPIPEVDQLAALATKWPPGIVVPASQALALWAGVGLRGVVVSHGISGLLIVGGDWAQFNVFGVWRPASL